jgi:hypothetical protein
LLAKRFEACTAFFKIRSAPFHLSTEIQELRGSIPLFDSLADQGCSLFRRNSTLLHHGQALCAGRELFLSRLVSALLRQSTQFTYLIDRGSTRERFRQCFQRALPIPFRDAAAFCFFQHFVSGFESGRHLP